MIIPRLLRYALGTLALAAIASACTHRATDCNANANCDGTSAGSGGTSGQGGEGSSDTLGGNTAQGGTTTTHSTTAAPCGGLCADDTPHCEPNKNICVACLTTEDCRGIAVCKASSGTCVPCLANTDCAAPTAPVCNLTTAAAANTCEAACTTDDDCSRFAGTKACNTKTGACVVCTASNETACGANACNPATNICTTTTKGSVDVCRSCVADSECKGGDLASPTAGCVPMTFGVESASHGNYCLKLVSADCSLPFSVPITTASVSGAASATYCGLNQAATTCEAVVDMIASKTCAQATDCGGGNGGQCQAISIIAPANRCTIPCGTDNQCSSGMKCSTSLNYCGQ